MSTTQRWLYGLGSTFISGAVTAIAATYVAPDVFNFTSEGLIKLGQLALAGGIIGIVNYLQKSPLPKYDKVQ